MSARATIAESPPADLAVASRTPDRRWNVAIVAAFGLLVGATMWRHEMWRDELQAWMIARDSRSLSELSDRLRFEGHPFLWYLMLWPIARHASQPWPMQVVQWSAAVATMAVVAWRAPFTRGQKALFALGYFALFEYGVMSRSYSLGFLCVVLICSVAATRHRWPWCGLLLVLLASTTVFGAMLAVALLAGLLVDEWMRQRAGEPVSLPAVTVPALFVGVALAVSYDQSAPPQGHIYRPWTTSFDLELVNTCLAAVWRALVPMPKPTREFWNTNVADGFTIAGTLLGMAALVSIAWLLRRRPAAAVVWLLGASSVVVFLYTKIRFASSARHFGHVFIALVAAVWLASATRTAGAPGSDAPLASVRRRAWTSLLVLQAIAGVFAVTLDLAYPFSNGKQVAAYLRSEGWADELIVGIPDTSSSVIAAYLDRGIYYPAGGRFGTYILWDEERIGPAEPLREGLRRLQVGDRPVLLVANEPDPPGAGFRLELLASFDDGIVTDEHYWVFRVLPAA